MSAPLEIFCCYAPKDQEMLESLKKHLMPLRRQGQITIWSDTDVDAGVEWEKELRQHLESADIILLLISPDFMNSDYCYSTEMGRAIERHDQGSAVVIPILLRATSWHDAPFAKLQVLPRNARPVRDRGWFDIDEAFYTITEEIKGLVSKLQTGMKDRVDPNQIVPIRDGAGQSNPEVLGDTRQPIERKIQAPRRLPFSILLTLALVSIVLLVSIFTVPRLFSPRQISSTSTPTQAPQATLALALPTPVSTPTTIVPPTGSPTFSDPLQDNSQGYQWDHIDQPYGTCGFVTGKYYLVTAPAGQHIGCSTNEAPESIFGNFAYQITMTILDGMADMGPDGLAGAGPTFRVDPNNGGLLYKASFDSVGNWYFGTYNDIISASGTSARLPGALCAQPCPYFHTGLNQPNILTVQAVANHLDLWVNGHLIDACTDNTYPSAGFLGVQLESGNSFSSVTFSNLHVWKL